MFTFTDLQILCAESIFLKYSAYFLPLLLFIIVKHVWSWRFADGRNEKIQVEKEVIDIGKSIPTDSTNDDDDVNGIDDYKPHLPERLEHVPFGGLKECLDKSGAKFYELTNDRRSIRKFNKNKPVDIAVIEKCILAAGESHRTVFRK